MPTHVKQVWLEAGFRTTELQSTGNLAVLRVVSTGFGSYVWIILLEDHITEVLRQPREENRLFCTSFTRSNVHLLP